MSLPQPAPRSQIPMAPKPVPKPRPPIPSKPSPNGSDCPTVPKKCSETRSSGKVKRIVSKFTEQGNMAGGGGTEGARLKRGFKRFPTIKPKPQGRSKMGEQPPPLPLKNRNRSMKRVATEPSEVVPEQGESMTVSVRDEGRRSAPDGREVLGEVQMDGGVESEAEQDLDITSSLHCEKDCSCLCHLERPGMRLVWVPVEAEDDEVDGTMEEGEINSGQSEGETESGTGEETEEEEEEEEGEVEEEEEEEIGESGSSGLEEGEGSQLGRAKKEKFQKVLGIMTPVLNALQGWNNPCLGEQRTCSQPSLTGRPRVLNLPVFHGASLCPSPPLRNGLPCTARPPCSVLLTAVCCVARACLRDCPKVPFFPRPPPPPPKTGQEVRRLSDQSLQSTQQRRDIEEDGGSDSEREEQHRDPKNLLRGLSVDLKSQLLDEPLYQTYRDTVIHKEIKRQTVCRNISKASVDFQMDWGVRRGTDPERRGTASSTQNTLWQQLPSVRDSGILETLSPVQRQHQESMFEVLTSEASYLRSLRVLIDHFMESRDLEDTLIIREKKILFSNIVRVCETSESFLTDLEERIEKSVLITDICDIIYYHAQHKFPVYIDYVRNQIYQEKTYTTLMQKNGQFSAVIARLQESPQCQRLPFMSFLLLPFQRITRIKMLIENILKRTQEGTKEEETTSKALAAVSKIIEECNSEVGKMRQMEELIHIAQTLEFDKMKAIPVVSKNRFLVKRGEVQEMAKGATLFRSRFTPIFLFLFNDLLILTSKKSSERYVVIDHAHRSLVQVKDFDEASAGPGFDNCFSLILLENHQNRLSERLLKVPTQSDKDRWMAAFPDPDEPEGDRDEAVYEEVDCPQVQCIEQYIAQQGDELTLEPTEIVNVIRKGNEGWYEGIRLSDGQKGWFPVGNVLEITNEHVRRRNLRERYRVIHAAGMMSHGLKSKSMPGK
ncbi:hypothetical protein COCON_G00044940 [Conger conger]|uniref:Rho guanine nucleotide exchange factor 15 n=1 Tax=Conger conger TaxID=82655 RepID=A0A9Q1DUD8_CONCO|nr:hypothetical protein COCON_G00044940 [Conger conger]